MKDYALLNEPKPMVTEDKNELRGTANRIFYSIIIDPTGKTHRVRRTSFIISSLGRHVFSSPLAIKTRVTIILEKGNRRLQKGEVVVP